MKTAEGGEARGRVKLTEQTGLSNKEGKMRAVGEKCLKKIKNFGE